MKPIPFRKPAHLAAPSSAASSAASAKRVVVWLGGGDAQRSAIELAVGISVASGAQLTGLSAFDPEPEAQAIPAGGTYWARWLADQRRARRREAAAAALRDFDEATRGHPIEITSRHDETGFDGLATVVAGCDLLVVPAGAGLSGSGQPPSDELATTLAARSAVPVLRVRHHPAAVRNVVLVVSGTDGCARLARRFLHSGLWTDAPVTLLPVAGDRQRIQAALDEQVELVRAHGRKAEVMPAVDPDSEADVLDREVRRFDAAAMSCLSHRSGWLGMVRTCPFEVVSDRMPVTLLP
ncbi:universal stress protein (plasmid) [Skermanella mucosa]|uniref:universal stress protein n=1 Tax=Skermanella mucosa TaxID=1789672 RepID=UPI00192AFB3D|nr:universal stress protein [Skermanella mucosa]UEM24666.1 universal stress protein [Skermanella mucosa]